PYLSPLSLHDALPIFDAAQNRIVRLDPAPANNTWVIAIRGDLPTFPGRKCLDSLAAYLAEGGRFKLAASAEFVESPAALPAFEKDRKSTRLNSSHRTN